MAVSTFDLYKIGIGPSSSHTVGPMRAAARFVEHHLAEAGRLQDVARVRAEVFGSLALTGRGHGTDKAVLMGLEGQWPNLIDPDLIPAALQRIRGEKKIRLHGQHEIAFNEKTDLVLNKRQKLPFHTNGMRFIAYDADGGEIASRDYSSVGGGFVVNQDEAAEDRIVADTTELAHPFHTGAALLEQCERSGLSIAQLQPDLIIVDAESEARDALEHVVMATRNERRPIVMFTNDDDTSHVKDAVAAGVSAHIVAGLAPQRIRPILGDCRTWKSSAANRPQRSIFHRLFAP